MALKWRPINEFMASHTLSSPASLIATAASSTNYPLFLFVPSSHVSRRFLDYCHPTLVSERGDGGGELGGECDSIVTASRMTCCKKFRTAASPCSRRAEPPVLRLASIQPHYYNHTESMRRARHYHGVSVSRLLRS